MSTVPFVYFGGEPLGAPILATLIAHNLRPALVICKPDRPAGRGLALTPSPVKMVAESNNIPVWQPTDFNDQASISECLSHYELFVVVAYNKILPHWLIELPKYKTINVHPSLLPKLRGPSPIRSAILHDEPESVGVSIMLMDEAMDHGPLLESVKVDTPYWPMRGLELDELLITVGGELLATTLPEYINGSLVATEQDHSAATYTKKLSRADGELAIDLFLSLPEPKRKVCSLKSVPLKASRVPISSTTKSVSKYSTLKLLMTHWSFHK
jgi:methionyl-tRNA formyltransferase